MPLILHIETSTKSCSVALSHDGVLLAEKESMDERYAHSEKLTTYIQEIICTAGVDLKTLDAIAVSKGPGSYTGLRIGIATAKGLCYALNIPLIGIETLKGMAHGVASSPFPFSKGEGASDFPVYHTAEIKIWKKLKDRGREMRKNPTDAEEVLWKKLRNKKTGYKIRRQHSIDKFIVDFVCLEKQLVIEVDGEVHQTQIEWDKLRDAIIGEKGFTVLRFPNQEVLNNIDFVIKTIREILDRKPSLPPRGRVGDGALYCPMLDARRMEVYCAVYDSLFNEIFPTSAVIIDENSFLELLSEKVIFFFGDGADKCRKLITHPNAKFISAVFPSAKNLIRFSEEAFQKKQFEDIAYCEPFYLKDFIGLKNAGNSV